VADPPDVLEEAPEELVDDPPDVLEAAPEELVDDPPDVLEEAPDELVDEAPELDDPPDEELVAASVTVPASWPPLLVPPLELLELLEPPPPPPSEPQASAAADRRITAQVRSRPNMLASVRRCRRATARSGARHTSATRHDTGRCRRSASESCAVRRATTR